MSICFTWFPIGGLGEPYLYHDLGVIYKNMGIILGGCLTCEELVGSITGDDGVGFRGGYCFLLFSIHIL